MLGNMNHIRIAMITDARVIAKVHVSCWQAIYRGHIPNNILDKLSVDDREKLWISLLANHVGVLVLEEDNELIGFISFCPSRDQDNDPKFVAEISAIYLNPNKWGKGLGKLLCNAAIDELKKLSYKELTLWVLDGNKQARQFYEKMGFIKTSDIKIDQEDGYTLREVRYKKTL